VIASTAVRRFSLDDQQAFAEVSGDFDPMHMDPIAARRTSAGDCVVHGVQSMLWALEELADSLELERLRSVDADFGQFLYVANLSPSHSVAGLRDLCRKPILGLLNSSQGAFARVANPERELEWVCRAPAERKP
jgi:Asp/Glu/hydantoin racemase